jgi:hypothetical protein
MITDRQLDANRRNSRKSTGPRTAAGKSRASANSRDHGLRGLDVVLPSERTADYDHFRAGLLESLDPHGGLEESLADQVITASWRIRRIPILEAALHRRGRHELAIDQARTQVSHFRAAETAGMLSAIAGRPTRSEPRQLAERTLAEAEYQKQDLVLRDPLLRATQILEASAPVFTILWRHERALTRSLQGILHELQRLQAIRAGEAVAAPAVIDLDVRNLEAASARPQFPAAD